MCPPANKVTGLMGRFRQGDRAAAGELFELFYPQLKQIAAKRMRLERSPHTWQPTALVNELYLELVKIRALRHSGSNEDDQVEFLKLSAWLMKRLLILHSRPLDRRVEHEAFDETAFQSDSGQASLQELDDLLDRLAEIHPQLRSVVELRVFEGLTGDEAAARLGCSPRTEARHWKFARSWLARTLGSSPEIQPQP
jgi:RNA polymerase sigma-70 factor (ECF subfamily)